MNLVLPLIWGSWAFFKAVMFSRQLLQNKILTKLNLLKQKIIVDPEGVLCSLCGGLVEFVDHLFVTCELTTSMWS